MMGGVPAPLPSIFRRALVVTTEVHETRRLVIMLSSITTRLKWSLVSLFDRQINTIITGRLLAYHRLHHRSDSLADDRSRSNQVSPSIETEHPSTHQCERIKT